MTIELVDKKGYCSNCGNWATDCKQIVVYSIPEKICRKCRGE